MIAILALVLALAPPEERCAPHGKGTAGYCPTVKMGDATYWTMVGEGDVIILERFPVVSGGGNMLAARWPRHIELQPVELIEGGLVLSVVKIVGGGFQVPPGADAWGPAKKTLAAAPPLTRFIPRTVDHRYVALALVFIAGSWARIRYWWRARPRGNRKVRVSPCPGCPACEEYRQAA